MQWWGKWLIRKKKSQRYEKVKFKMEIMEMVNGQSICSQGYHLDEWQFSRVHVNGSSNFVVFDKPLTISISNFEFLWQWFFFQLHHLQRYKVSFSANTLYTMQWKMQKSTVKLWCHLVDVLELILIMDLIGETIFLSKY